MAYNKKNKICSIINALLARGITCVSDAAFEAYPGFVKKIKSGRIIPIENGVDMERIDKVLKTLEFDKGRMKRFVYIARMIPVKNHQFILDVFSRLHGDYELVLIGAEDSNGDVRRRVDSDSELKKHTVLTGPIPRNDVFKWLKKSEVYVSPSKVEGLPVSVMEAMSAGLPVILSDIQPHCELRKGDDAEAIEVLPLDVNVWVERITDYLDAENDILVQRGEKCRRVVGQYFSLDTMHDKYYAEYKKLLN